MTEQAGEKSTFSPPTRCGKFCPALRHQAMGRRRSDASGRAYRRQHHHAACSMTRARNRTARLPAPSHPIGPTMRRAGISVILFSAVFPPMRLTPASCDRQDENQFQMRHCSLTTRSSGHEFFIHPRTRATPGNRFDIFRCCLDNSGGIRFDFGTSISSRSSLVSTVWRELGDGDKTDSRGNAESGAASRIKH